MALLNQFGKDSIMAMTDIKNDFRIITIHPDDYKPSGFSWEGSLKYNKCLPMGASSSCLIVESLSQALQWLCIRSLMLQVCLKCLTIFFFIGSKHSQKCPHVLNQSIYM